MKLEVKILFLLVALFLVAHPAVLNAAMGQSSFLMRAASRYYDFHSARPGRVDGESADWMLKKTNH